MTKLGWKVLTLDRLSIFSIYPIFYTKDRWVYPEHKNGPLAVFDTYENAVKFMKDIHLAYQIVECEYVKSDLSQQWFQIGKTDFYYLHKFPKGTILAERVKCLG